LKKLLTSAAFALLSTATLAQASDIMADCDFTSWRGASQPKYSQSWLGMGFLLKKDQKLLLLKSSEEAGKYWELPVKKVVPAKKFTSYKAYLNTRGLRLTINYRVYNDKKARATITVPGYQMMTASGTCK